MRLSVVIPAYQRLADVLRCLNTLRQTAVTQVQFHVQDDTSPDVFFPHVIPPEIATVARNEQNLGFPMNCNAGARYTQGDVVCFVNQDIYAAEISHGWDAAILEGFNNPVVGIVGPRLLFPSGSVQSAGGVFDSRYQPFHRCLNWSNPAVETVATPDYVDWTTGAVFAVRRWLWDSLGGFDSMFHGGYFEDADFCLRALESGVRVWYAPQATLYHEVGTSGGNPHFMTNAVKFRQRWVDSGKAEKLLDTQATVREGWW